MKGDGRRSFANGRKWQRNLRDYKALWSRASDVVIMGAYGGYERGWAEVDPRLSSAAAQRRPRGIAFETLNDFVAATTMARRCG